MPNSTHLYGQSLDFWRQYSRARDLRHLKALAWMVSALICSGQLSLSAWDVESSEKSTECRAAMAEVFGECTNSGDGVIFALGTGRLKMLW
jgi:hypothetical protein